VKLTDSEHEALEARAHAERVPKAAVLRAAIAPRRAPGAERSPGAGSDHVNDVHEVEPPAPTRARVLAQLADAADLR
jgi:hypothetical protein